MKKKKPTVKKWIISALAVTLMYSSVSATGLQPVSANTGAPAAQTEEEAIKPSVSLLGSSPITSGAIMKHYEWKLTDKNRQLKSNVYVIEVDLHNPMVKLDTIAGTGGQYTKRQTVQEMAVETGAVAAINGDFYNTRAEGVPNGPQIVDRELIATTLDIPGLYAFALDQENRPIIDLFTFEGEIRTIDGAAYPLGGINKTYFWYEPSGEHSMINGLYMYTDAWGQENRSNDGVTVPTEVMVQNGIITQIAPNTFIRDIAPEDGYILRASGRAAEFVLAHMKVGDPLIADYRILPQDPNKAYDASQFRTMIGGGTILVDEGQAVELSRKGDASPNSARSRTAIGYTQDGRYALLVTVERAGNSEGMNLTQLQQLMIELGAWKSMNLDGGGSTQIVSRPLGELNTKLVNRPEDSVARRVVNGIGVYSLAPAGEPAELIVEGNTRLFLNERASFKVKAYDQYFNPIDMTDVELQWEVADQKAVVEDNQVVMLGSGTTTVAVSYGDASQSIEVSSISREDIASMKLETSAKVVDKETRIELKVVATLTDGTVRAVPADLIDWEWRGFEGTREQHVVQVDELDNQRLVQIIGTYDGFRTMVSLPVGQRKDWADFDQLVPPLVFQSYPQEVSGDVALIASLPDRLPTDRALYLGYDFREGSGTKAAYAAFGEEGIELEAIPHSIRMEVLGDKSGNWLRAEMVDGNGKTYLVKLGDQTIDWSGWKTIDTDLTSLGMAYPVTLKRIYVANPEPGQEDRASLGAIAIDNISILFTGMQMQDQRPVVTLSINNKQMKVGEDTVLIDQPPIIMSDHTMVPVRFVVEALGGEIEWDGLENKVTVLKDENLIDMWLDQEMVIMNGVSVAAAVAPTLVNGRTMVPLRLLAEKLGWNIEWDDATRSITLY